jgi:hypothetical protein
MKCKHIHTFNIPAVDLTDGSKAVMICVNCLSIKSTFNYWMLPSAEVEPEDSTGLCTVRDWAKEIFNSNIVCDYAINQGERCTRIKPKTAHFGEMKFNHNGFTYNVQTLVTGKHIE